ncbi:9-O-acetylesterase [Robertkochia solimangrovi]|nr:9-O-acetylesterase [Robertkochia solimangrovi]
MVIQREKPVNVWGWNSPGAEVSVTFNNVTETVITDKEGGWMVTFPEMTAGGPFEMAISSGTEEIALEDIMVGDVWLCSGQSNMEWLVVNANNAEEEISNAENPLIRHFKVPLTYSTAEESELAGGEWQVSNPENTGMFTAVGYYFARNLLPYNGNVAIGLLNSSWGGSRIEPWMSMETLDIENLKAYLKEQEVKSARQFETSINEYRKKFRELDISDKDMGMKGIKPLWNTVDLDESSWADIQAPGLWESQGFNALDGFAWYRKTIELTPEEAQQVAELGAGKVDDTDYTWVNGVLVGSTEQSYESDRVYPVKSGILKAGKNVITIRVEDTGGGGGIHGGAEGLYLKTASGTHSLAGTWKFRIGKITPPQPAYNQIATLLYNKMIHPILNFPLAGVIWYQGESNADNEADAVAYKELFPDMIQQWRKDWNQDDLPFLWVQLANFMTPKTGPEESNWALLREAQSQTLKLPYTGEAVIIDLGEADDIHPKNKQDVGYRLSLPARKIYLGEDIEYSGPVLKSVVQDNDQVILTFDHTGKGLKAKGATDEIFSFDLAGADGVFYPATAKLKGDKVIVSTPEVTSPVHVRYAWANNPSKANLYNSLDLPASPFSTKIN